MESKLVQRIKEYLEYTKNRKDISRENKKAFLRTMELNLKYIHSEAKRFESDIFKPWRYDFDTNLNWYSPPIQILADRLLAIEDIDNPTDEELETVIEKGGFKYLSLYRFLWGERAYNFLYKDVDAFYIGNFGTHTFTVDFIDFFATLPPAYIEKVSFEDLHFFNCAIMNALCIRNPLYLTHLNKIINPKLATITHIMGSTNYTQLFKLCAAVAYYCNKQAIPDSKLSFLKEYASLIRIYQYDYHTVLAHIVNTALDNKDGTLYTK